MTLINRWAFILSFDRDVFAPLLDRLDDARQLLDSGAPNRVHRCQLPGFQRGSLILSASSF